ncbi:MAG: dephospho-CoA kinase [Thermoleophilia bacterium]|nr:dephospho-CoA kinase [Thermoleophilia bacterium]
MAGIRKKSPVRIALTGGIGSGKSTALTMFAARKAAVLNSDNVVHKLLQRRDVRDRVAASLGIGSLSAGEEGRTALADTVFADEAKLDRLEAIMFPLVREAMESWLQSEEVRSAPLAVVELPMLFEAGMEDMFDHIVLITAPVETRQSRYAGRVARDDFQRRAAHQLSEEEKRVRSGFVYENTGSPEELDEFVAAMVEAVTGGLTPPGDVSGKDGLADADEPSGPRPGGTA